MREAPVHCVIVGAGGHAAALIDCMQRGGALAPDCLLDANPARWNTHLHGVPVLGDDGMFGDVLARGVRAFTIGVGRNDAVDRRRALFDRATAAGLEPITVIDPTALVSPRAKIEPGAQILAAAVINIGARVGRNVVVNTAAVVEHDCSVGDHAFIGPGVVLAGGVVVGEGAFIGVGAIVLPGVSLGAGAVVAAGAVVRSDVGSGTVVAGMPARPLGQAS